MSIALTIIHISLFLWIHFKLEGKKFAIIAELFAPCFVTIVLCGVYYGITI